MPQFTRTTVQAVRGLSGRYQLRPAVGAGAVPAGLVLVSAAKDFGADQDFVAVGAITTEYWLCGAFIDATDEAVAWDVQFRDATPTLLWTFRHLSIATTAQSGHNPPYPIWMAGSAQLQGRAKATTVAKVLGVTALIGTGL